MTRLSTGIPELNGLVGGGWPREAMSHLYAFSGTGTTSVALAAAAEVTRERGTVAYIDWDYALSPERLATFGVSEAFFRYYTPETLEDGLVTLLDEVSKADLIVLDKCGCAIPKRALLVPIADMWAAFLATSAEALHSGPAILGLWTLRRGFQPSPPPQDNKNAHPFLRHSTLSVWFDREGPSRQMEAVVKKNMLAALDPDQSATFKMPGDE